MIRIRPGSAGSSVFPALLAVAGAGLVVVFAIPEFLGRGYPGIGRTQTIGILGGFVLIGAAHVLAFRSPGGLRTRDLPWMLGLASLLFAGTSWWVASPGTSVPDSTVYERLLAVERAILPPRKAIGQCLPPAANRPIPRLALEPVVAGLQKPVYVTTAGDGSRRLFIAEKGGAIRVAEGDRLREEPFLDIRDRVLSDDLPHVSWEQGLLGVAFSPDFERNGEFYVHYTAMPDGTVTISRFLVGNDLYHVDSSSEEIILTVPTVGPDHNGGQLQFGPDGYLYVAIGDGAGGRWPHGDPNIYGDGAYEHDEAGHLIVPPGSGYTAADLDTDDPWNQAQDLGTLRGKILRLDVRSDDAYAVPSDNPYAMDGRESTRSEIWAYGLRNPWRFSFDPCNGDLFTGDVGRSDYEEINLIEPGGNYGWKVMEAGHCFPLTEAQTCASDRFEFPIAEYPHIRLDATGGNAIIGGYVYRGRQIPSLIGRYVFGDFMSARLWTLTPTGLDASGWEMREFMIVGFLPTSFGLDADGELLVVGYGGTIYRLIPAETENGVSPAR